MIVVSTEAPIPLVLPCLDSVEDVCIIMGVDAAVDVISREPEDVRVSVSPNRTARTDCTTVSGL